ncbi:MAG: hypothetical protein IKS51_04970 [Erysipelotrichaceae bacterium]|nr:hypothetical protein [Erysipelotrichaceae bacterium]
MKEFSVPMALVDYIPVLFFGLGVTIIANELYKEQRKGKGLLFLTGAGLVIAAGFLKATYKLLYALGVGEFAWMSDQFFSNQAFGFLLAGIALVLTVVKKEKAYSFLPTMALVGIMVVGLGALDAGLCFLASKAKKRNALVCFIVSFFLCLMMGYLSSKDFDKAFMNWVAQLINIAGQGLFYLGARFLKGTGLKDLI